MRSLIQQPFGIGDIIFCQNIAHKLIEDGFAVFWPVQEMFLHGLKKAYPLIKWLPENQSPINLNNRRTGMIRGFHCVPIRFSDTIQGVPYKYVMRAKYDMMGMNWEEWTKRAKWVRDLEKESQLKNLVGAVGEYTLVNNNFHGKHMKRTGIKTEGCVEMRYVDGYSLFDWAGVIEAAKDIHTVSTSIVYLMEILQLNCVPSIYIRHPQESNHDNYKYLLKKEYNFV